MDEMEARKFREFIRNPISQFVLEKLDTDARVKILEAKNSDKFSGKDKDKEILRAVEYFAAVCDIRGIFNILDASAEQTLDKIAVN